MTPLDFQIAKDMATIGLLAPVILAALKPYLSRLPIAAPTSPDRDLVLNTALYLINLVLLVGMLSQQDMFDPRYWLTILVGAAGQHVVSALAYRTVKSTVPAVQAAKAQATARATTTPTVSAAPFTIDIPATPPASPSVATSDAAAPQ